MSGKIVAIIIVWVAILAFALLTGEAEGSLGGVVLSALIMAVVAVAAFSCGGDTEASAYRKPKSTRFISCMKCGYLGVGSGSCPRCGSNRTRKVATHTSMVSCKKCGYLGAGSGTCPRCGSTWAEVINK